MELVPRSKGGRQARPDPPSRGLPRGTALLVLGYSYGKSRSVFLQSEAGRRGGGNEAFGMCPLPPAISRSYFNITPNKILVKGLDNFV